jgi:hypothetical protein
VSAHGPPRLYFEPLKLLNFDLNADPDPAPKIMRIQICYPVGYDLKTRARPHTVNPGPTLQRKKQAKIKD